jgi:hypothetical protein
MGHPGLWGLDGVLFRDILRKKQVPPLRYAPVGMTRLRGYGADEVVPPMRFALCANAHTCDEAACMGPRRFCMNA